VLGSFYCEGRLQIVSPEVMVIDYTVGLDDLQVYKQPPLFHNFLTVSLFPTFLIFDPLSSLKFIIFPSTCTKISYSTMILYSRDHSDVVVACDRISPPKTSLNSPIWRYGSIKTKPKRIFRLIQNTFNK